MGTPSLALLMVFALGRVEPLDAPPLDDIWRFPRACVCKEWLRFGRAHEKWVWSRYQAVYSDLVAAGFWWDYYCQVGRRTDAWEALADAWDERYFVRYRRDRLMRLRELIGEEQYFCGFVPVPPDVRYFQLEE